MYVAVVLPGEQALGEQEKQSCFIRDWSGKGIVHCEIVSGQQTSVVSRDSVRWQRDASCGSISRS